MERKKQVAGRNLKKVALQPQETVIPSSSLSARPGMQSALQRMETPLDLPLPLMALFNAIVPMPYDHNILILMEDATFRLPVEYIYVSKEDNFQFSRIEQISIMCITSYIK